MSLELLQLYDQVVVGFRGKGCIYLHAILWCDVLLIIVVQAAVFV